MSTATHKPMVIHAVWASALQNRLNQVEKS
jgi:hypothetical protein